MRRVKTIFLLFLTCTSYSYGQQSSDSGVYRPSNTIGLNIAGDAAILGLNYERLFLHEEAFFIATKIGIGVNKEIRLFGQYAPMYATVPLSITANVGKHKSYLEFGFGFTTLANDKQVFYFGYPILGYRYFPILSKQFFIRVSAEIPVITQNLNVGTYPGSSLPEFYDRVIFSPIGVHLGIAF